MAWRAKDFWARLVYTPQRKESVTTADTVCFAQLLKLSTGLGGSSKTLGAASGLLVALPGTSTPGGSGAPSDAVVRGGAPTARRLCAAQLLALVLRHDWSEQGVGHKALQAQS